jgi:CPA1 family monovalent cation:H+ antiporter
VQTFEAILGLIGFCLLLDVIARRLRVPTTVALILGGVAVAFIPGLPVVELDPDLALALFLPPLLQLSAYRTDWPAFRTDLRPILFLAVGAVLFSAVAVALVARWLVPGLPFAAALALGAIVAPPDAVAAAAVLKVTRPPRRLVTLLEGESLLNDATSLVLYRFAVTGTLVGHFDLAHGVGTFFASAAGGLLLGWLVGRTAMWCFSRLDDTLHDIAASVLASFVAYFLAEAVHASGVLAVVGCGLVLGRHQHQEFTARTRLDAASVWRFIEFVLSGLVFMLIGLQLRGILARLADHDPWSLAGVAAAVSAMLVVSRFAWMGPMVWLPRLLMPRLRRRVPVPPFSHLVVLSWAGMRGVVSLAAALALPIAFPGRDLIVFLAFCAIVATLVLQGTTLGPLIRWLRVGEPDTAVPNRAEVAVRRRATAAALVAVEARLGDAEHPETAGDLLEEYQDRSDQVRRLEHNVDKETARLSRELTLRLDAVRASRASLSDRDRHGDEAVRAMLEELDLEEEQLRRELGE